jgi:restriction system protein
VLFIDWFITLFATLPTPGLIPEPWNTLVFLSGFILLLIGEASRLGLLRHRLRARVDIRHNRSLQSLKNMDPNDFEYLVAETYQSLGYEANQVGHSGDHGVDVRLRAPNGELWIVQCKRYRGTVGENIVRELYGTMMSEKSARAVLITTAHITPPAIEWARGKPIELIDGQRLLKLMDEAYCRNEGSFLTRLATWFEGLLVPGRPDGLQPENIARASLEATQPVRIQRTAPVQVVGLVPTGSNRYRVPICPNCGIPMIPHPPRPTDRQGRALFRCRNYPTCRVVLE